MKPTTAAHRLVDAQCLILLAAICFVVLIIVGRVPRVFAAAGDLDASFGTGGKVTTDSGFGGNDTGYAVVAQPDGKIVTAGQCVGSFCLVRHNADGSLDDGGPDDFTPGDAFGVGGSVVTGFGTDTAAPTSMVRQPDGKLVVLGSCGAVTTNVCIIRYNVDGSLDDGGPDDATSGDAFGTGGIVKNTAGPAAGYAVALQTDGKLVVAGGCVGPDACVLRFNADGSFDDGGPDDSTPGDVFGAAGLAKADFGTVIDQFNAMTIDQTSGKILAAGGCFFNGSLNFCIARFNPDGTFDSNSDADPTTHLGATGAVTLDFGGADMAKAVAIQPADGKIVVAGRCAFNLLGSFCFARLSTNGTIDTSFNASGAVPGSVITTFAAGSDDTLNALVIQSDGKLVGSGFGTSGARLVRYNANGTLDTDSDAEPGIHFNHTGKVTSATLVLAFGLARQPTDGKLVAVGVCGGADSDFCITRYDTQGAPDLTLGGTGFVTTDFGGGNDSGEAVVREPNDKVVVAGECHGKFCAVRYDLDGELDATFGNRGFVTTDMPGGGLVHGLVRQADGKLVAAGNCNSHFCLVRWNGDGSLDDGGPNDSTPGDGAFGTTGIVVSIFASIDDGRALLVQPDGKLVVAGGCGSTNIFCVARYNVNGSLDDGTVDDSTPGDAFGSAGRVSTNVAPGPETALAIARQPSDGKLVVAGLCANTSADDVCLVRYNVDGSLDSGVGNDATPGDSFGTAGQVITNVGNVDTLGALAVQTDGRIIAAGSSGFAKSFVARYNVDGSLDDGGAGDTTAGDSFGTGGKVLTDATPGNEGYSGLAIQPADGKIVAAGACGDASFTSGLCVARYTTGGVLDGTFGPGGLVATSFFAKKDASAAGVVLLSDERIVAAGRTLSPGRQNDFALARYFGNGLVTPTPSVTPAATKTASRTPTPHATATLTSGGTTPTSALSTATVTPAGASATPTPVATRTPAPEDCSDCIDNDFDGGIDRADSDCPLPADGQGVGLGGPAAKAAVACEKTIVKAGTTFALKRVKGLSACLQSAFACVEQKASEPACLAKAGAACAKAESARQVAVGKLTATILAKCDAPTLAPADLIARVGLGFMDEQSACTGFGVPLLQNATDVALCTAGRHACRAEALLGTALPRARELLTLAGHDPAVEASCLPPGGSGGASANGKGVVKCQKGIASAGAAYGAIQLGARQKCVAAVLACIQLKPGDGPCLVKAGATCAKLDTRIAAASAKLTATIAKGCGGPLALADVVGPLGIGFGLRDGSCQALGIPALDSTAAVAACVKAEADCRVGQLLEGQTPRAGELRALVP